MKPVPVVDRWVRFIPPHFRPSDRSLDEDLETWGQSEASPGTGLHLAGGGGGIFANGDVSRGYQKSNGVSPDFRRHRTGLPQQLLMNSEDSSCATVLPGAGSDSSRDVFP